jgi:hypothetical protein
VTTVTWGGRSGDWLFPTFWRPFVTPGAQDVVVFAAPDSSTATIDAAATVGTVTLESASQATILIQNTLTVLGQLVAQGGTIDLEPGGTIEGGTIDLRAAAVVANGGVIDGAVWIGDLGRGITVTAATVAATQAAAEGAALAVTGTLGLVAGTYGAILSLDAFGAVAPDEIDATGGGTVVFAPAARLVLSQDDPSHTPGSSPGGPAPVIGGNGTIENRGLLLSDAQAATIDASGFVNLGSIVLNDASVTGMSEYFLSSGLLAWNATLAPSLTLLGTDFANDGTITGQGATLDAVGGRFVNTGLIDLGQASGQGPVLLPLPHVGTLLLVSTLDIGAGVTGFANTGTLAAGTISLDGDVSLADLGTLVGTVVFNGTLDLGGGTLDASTLPATTSYILAGTVTDGTILNANGRIVTQIATLDQVTVLYTQPTTLSDVLGPGTIVLSDSTSELDYTAAATVTGLTVRTELLDVPARISVTAGAVTFDPSTLISATTAGGSMVIGGGGVFVEDGDIQLQASDLEVTRLDGTGTVTLGANAVMTIDSLAPTAALTVQFGPGTNALVLPGDGSGRGALDLRLAGLAPGDLLDFTGVSAAPGAVPATPGATLTGGTLHVVGASGDQASLITAATGLTFVASTDPDGGTLISVACFRHGTRLATPDGPRPVETLRIGDPVLTHGGAIRPIRWLGHRAYPAALIRRQPQLRPVRLAAGALGGGLPRRRLDLSPLHAVLIDGVLVPVAALVDGRAITRAPIAATAYVHVELESPDILLAEGAPAESYVDCDNRAMFDNARDYRSRYRDDPPGRWNFPAPRVEEGWALRAIQERLAGATTGATTGTTTGAPPGPLRGHIDVLSRDRLEGWAMDAAHPAEPIELELIAAGRQLGCLLANRYRIDLDRAGQGRGRCGFTADLPELDAGARASLALIRLSDGARLTP